jgi:hypothetical protein
MEFYSAMKRNEILSFTDKWMELEDIIFFISENKFYLNKGLNTLHNIKTGREKKTKNQFVTSCGLGQLLLISQKLYS